MKEQNDLLSFAGWRGLAKWLIGTDSGRRFVNWFIRKYHKEIMSLEAGAAIYGYLQEKAVKDSASEIAREVAKTEEKRGHIVIELSHDPNHGGTHVEVYGTAKYAVSFAELLKHNPASMALEGMSRAIAFYGLSHNARKIYRESAHYIGGTVYKPETGEEYSLRLAEIRFSNYLSREIREIESEKKSAARRASNQTSGAA